MVSTNINEFTVIHVEQLSRIKPCDLKKRCVLYLFYQFTFCKLPTIQHEFISTYECIKVLCSVGSLFDLLFYIKLTLSFDTINFHLTSLLFFKKLNGNLFIKVAANVYLTFDLEGFPKLLCPNCQASGALSFTQDYVHTSCILFSFINLRSH